MIDVPIRPPPKARESSADWASGDMPWRLGVQ